MSKLFRPLGRQIFKRLKAQPAAAMKTRSPFLTQFRAFSGPQEPPDTRNPEDVDPDWWDAWHWEGIIEDLEHEIAHYHPYWAILPLEELQYDLKFAKKMYEWRSLEEPKYLTPDEAAEQGVIESAFGYVGYKMRAELDYRVVGGRGGVDTKENFYDTAYMYGPFGTEEKPVLVPSRGRWRFVGCIGGYDGKQEHELAWIAIRQGPKHRCPLCGQIFQLWTSDSSHPDHPYHDPKFDYEKQLINMLMEGH